MSNNVSFTAAQLTNSINMGMGLGIMLLSARMADL